MTSNNTVRKARLAAERLFKESEAEADDRPADAPIRTGYRREFADGYTRHGRPGQCGACGAFRPDGAPPTVHRTDCVNGPDGSQLPALYDPAAVAAIKAKAVNGRLTADRPARPTRTRR